MSLFNAIVTVRGGERNYEFITNPVAGKNFIDLVLQAHQHTAGDKRVFPALSHSYEV